MYDNIPKLLKDLNIWLCYDARDRASYKGLSKEQIEDNKKAPRDIKGKKASSCPASVRCNARSKEQCSCFEDKENK